MTALSLLFGTPEKRQERGNCFFFFIIIIFFHVNLTAFVNLLNHIYINPCDKRTPNSLFLFFGFFSCSKSTSNQTGNEDLDSIYLENGVVNVFPKVFVQFKRKGALNHESLFPTKSKKFRSS